VELHLLLENKYIEVCALCEGDKEWERKRKKNKKREKVCEGEMCVWEKKIQRRKRYEKENICEKEIIYVHTRKCMRGGGGEVKHSLLFLA